MDSFSPPRHSFFYPFSKFDTEPCPPPPEKGRDTVLVFSQCISHLRLPISKLILHSHSRIVRLCKSLKATYTFSHKIKPRKLKNKPYFW